MYISIKLSNKHAIVIGPTPPGTGVIYPAISFTLLKSISPTNLPSLFLFVPTSITTLPFLTYSELIYSALPILDTSISASLHISFSSRVCE